jgi:hypothetical protein
VTLEPRLHLAMASLSSLAFLVRHGHLVSQGPSAGPLLFHGSLDLEPSLPPPLTGEPVTRGSGFDGRQPLSILALPLRVLPMGLFVSCRGTWAFTPKRGALRRERAAESLDSSGSSGLGVRLLLRTPGPWALVTWEIRLFTWAACAVRSPSRDDRESRENHAGGFLSGSKPLLRRGGHWKSPGLRVESPTLQNLIGTSKNAPRS